MLLRAPAVASLVIVSALLAGVAGHGTSVAAPGAAQWRRDAAFYLDARMDTWWANAKTLRTGAGEEKCISCHTALPYALARPALRKAEHAKDPTRHEDRLVQIARDRVAHVDDKQPYYDNTDAKIVESRGVEAVLNALVLTTYDAGRSATASVATRQAMAQLWAVQRQDGAFPWLEFGLEPYEAPDAAFHGATLAALAAGSAPGREALDADGRKGVERLRAYLRANLSSQRLFNRAWALLASSRLDGVLTPSERDAIVHELEARQRPDGGWSLTDLGPWRWRRQEAPFAPPKPTDAALLDAPDGYATGLVVYALRQSGAGSDRPSVRRGQAWLRRTQAAMRPNDPAWAPWRAYSLNYDREHGGEKGEPWRRMFMSDLATSFATLALL